MSELFVCQECKTLNEDGSSECSGCGIVLKWSSRDKYPEAYKALGSLRQALTIFFFLCAVVSFGIAVQMDHGVLRLMVALPGFLAAGLFWILLPWTRLVKNLIMTAFICSIGHILFGVYSGEELGTSGWVGLLLMIGTVCMLSQRAPE